MSVLIPRPKEEVTMKKEKRERDRDRQREGHGRGRGRPEVIQSHSIFEQGPAEMMKKKRYQEGTWSGLQFRLPEKAERGSLHSKLGSPRCGQSSLLNPSGQHDFPQGTGIRPWTCPTWDLLISSTSKKRREKQTKRPSRSCACWRRMT